MKTVFAAFLLITLIIFSIVEAQEEILRVAQQGSKDLDSDDGLDDESSSVGPSSKIDERNETIDNTAKSYDDHGGLNLGRVDKTKEKNETNDPNFHDGDGDKGKEKMDKTFMRNTTTSKLKGGVLGLGSSRVDQTYEKNETTTKPPRYFYYGYYGGWGSGGGRYLGNQ